MTVHRSELISYFLSEQNGDGSWALAPHYPGDVSTTTEAYFALKLLGIQPDIAPMQRARQFIISEGGIAKVRIFTRIFLATFGLFPWKAVPELPAELILLPATAPISIYRFSSWARGTIVPLLIICHHRPIFPLPNGTSETNDFLDELWDNPANKIVPHLAPTLELLRIDAVAFTFAAVDTVLYWLGGLRSFPLRPYARRKCREWILQHQEPEGDWAGIFPPMHAGVLALFVEGYKLDDTPLHDSLESIERFAWLDKQGKRIQPSVSPVWDTILTTIGLCDAGYNTSLSISVGWVKDRQILGPEGDWRIYRPWVKPGGFSFEYFNKWYPDVDGTAAAILAMIKYDPQSAGSLTVRRAVEWILGMQNDDGGWGAFDVNNDSLFLNKIPFSDMDSLCDPSSADVTGRILEAFGLLMEAFSKPVYGKDIPQDLIDRISLSCDCGISYLAVEQEATGAWFGRWGSNYIYGTSNVLCGLAYFSMKEKGTIKDNTVQDCIQSGIYWLKAAQNVDGGWGESLLSYKDPMLAGCGPSTPSQTAWALMGLLTNSPPSDISVQKGIRYLLQTQNKKDCEAEASWSESHYTGTGFPKHFYLGYTFYAHYFPMMALGRYIKLVAEQRAL
jgi:squalene-hopene/tetraprenyl-beta-curcumene cyclase